MKIFSKSWFWVPSLYFIEGLPYVAVMTLSVIFYKNMQISNTEIALYTSWFYLPWVIKPLWSPIVDLFKTKRQWIIYTQFFIGLSFGLLALTLPFENYFIYTVVFFLLIAFSSATHDISADGLYLIAQSQHDQAKFVGIRSTFYRFAMIFGQGIVVIIAGELQESTKNVITAWSITFAILFTIFLFFGLYHFFMLPRNENDVTEKESFMSEFWDVFDSFFKKKNILIILLFLLLFRFSEAQLGKMAIPFLLDSKMVGGLQISTTNVGFIYGTVGVILLVIGGLLGGYVISRQGLKKWIFPMALMVNLPNLIYFLFSIFHIYDYNLLLIGIAFDQFGSGFGFTAYLVYMMMISEGEHSTAHYAISTGIMALGMMLPGMFSGYIQEILGYKLFFLWILIATIPSLLIIKFLKIDDNYGKR